MSSAKLEGRMAALIMSFRKKVAEAEARLAELEKVEQIFVNPKTGFSMSARTPEEEIARQRGVVEGLKQALRTVTEWPL